VLGRRLPGIGDSGRAIVMNARSPALRRAQLSFGAMWAGEWAVMVTLGVVAFRDGGAAAVGLVAALRMLPAALLAPFAATLADAVRRERVLAWVGAVRAATLASAALVLALGGPPAAVYALVVAATIVQTLERGECFGEIALLCDCVRTATVLAAAGSLQVATLSRERFLTAVTGYSASAAAGERHHAPGGDRPGRRGCAADGRGGFTLARPSRSSSTAPTACGRTRRARVCRAARPATC